MSGPVGTAMMLTTGRFFPAKSRVVSSTRVIVIAPVADQVVPASRVNAPPTASVPLPEIVQDPDGPVASNDKHVAASSMINEVTAAPIVTASAASGFPSDQLPSVDHLWSAVVSSNTVANYSTPKHIQL